MIQNVIFGEERRRKPKLTKLRIFAGDLIRVKRRVRVTGKIPPKTLNHPRVVIKLSPPSPSIALSHCREALEESRIVLEREREKGRERVTLVVEQVGGKESERVLL